MTETALPAPVTEFVRSNQETDDVACVCGNTVLFEGFYPASTEGRWMNPAQGSGWDGLTIGCLNCGRTIDTHAEAMTPNPDSETNDWHPVLLPVTAPAGTLPGGELPDDVF